jgi:hypothetical protein
MTPETAFAIANTGILPAWLLLAFAPRWRVTEALVHGGWYIAAYCLLYTGFLVYALGFTPPVEGASFNSLAGVMALFSSPLGVFTGWVHYLALDLFVGAWEARDARRRGVPHWLLLPCLFFTLMFGPFGLLLYLAVRAFCVKTGPGLQETADNPAGVRP